jgi:hypothetical protein
MSHRIRVDAKIRSSVTAGLLWRWPMLAITTWDLGR